MTVCSNWCRRTISFIYMTESALTVRCPSSATWQMHFAQHNLQRPSQFDYNSLWPFDSQNIHIFNWQISDHKEIKWIEPGSNGGRQSPLAKSSVISHPWPQQWRSIHAFFTWCYWQYRSMCVFHLAILVFLVWPHNASHPRYIPK